MTKKYLFVCETLFLIENFLGRAKKLAVQKGFIPGTPQFQEEVYKIYKSLFRQKRYVI